MVTKALGAMPAPSSEKNRNEIMFFSISVHGLSTEQADKLRLKIKQRKFCVGRQAPVPILTQAEFDKIVNSTVTVRMTRLTEDEILRWTKG